MDSGSHVLGQAMMHRRSPPEAHLTNDKVVLSLPNNATPSFVKIDNSVQSIANFPPRVASFIKAAIADNTRIAYRQDLKDFEQWGGTIPATAEMLASYLADRAVSLSPHTLVRRAVGISRAHVSQGFADPSKNDLVRTVLRGIRRLHGSNQRQATPLVKHDLFALLPLMTGTQGLRDRAMVLLGFAAALRRSEIVAIDVQDLEFLCDGLVIHLRRSKTDQEGQGRKVAVPFGHTRVCPVKAVQAWLEHAHITEGAIFRPVKKGGQVQPTRLTAQSVALILKHYAQAAGLTTASISGHSLRSGLVTSAAQAGVAIHRIMAQTGHRSVQMVSKYIRDANLFSENAAGVVL